MPASARKAFISAIPASKLPTWRLIVEAQLHRQRLGSIKCPETAVEDGDSGKQNGYGCQERLSKPMGYLHDSMRLDFRRVFRVNRMLAPRCGQEPRTLRSL